MDLPSVDLSDSTEFCQLFLLQPRGGGKFSINMSFWILFGQVRNQRTEQALKT